MDNITFTNQNYKRSLNPDPQPEPVLQNDQKLRANQNKSFPGGPSNSRMSTPLQFDTPLPQNHCQAPVLPKISHQYQTQDQLSVYNGGDSSRESTPHLISPPPQMLIIGSRSNSHRQQNFKYLMPQTQSYGRDGTESISEQSKHRQDSENNRHKNEEIKIWHGDDDDQRSDMQQGLEYDQQEQYQQRIPRFNKKIVVLSSSQTEKTIQQQQQSSYSRSNKQSSHQSNSAIQSSQSQIPRWSRRCKFLTCMYHFVNHGVFNLVVILAIFANTIVLALDRYPIPDEQFHALETANLVLYSIFFIEMVLKITGMGFKEYAKDQFNIFDFSIVILSTVEIIVSKTLSNNGVQSGALSAFRGFRLLRVFKIARSWTSFQGLLRKIAETLKDIWSFIILLLIVIFCFALIGMEFFAYKAFFKYYDSTILSNSLDMDGISPRLNFNNLLNSVILIFVVLSGEDWQVIMYDYYRSSGPAAVIFFIMLVVVGNFIFLNLFLAILLKDFQDPQSFTKKKKKKDEIEEDESKNQSFENKKLAQKAQRKSIMQEGWQSIKTKFTSFFKGNKRRKSSQDQSSQQQYNRSKSSSAKSLIRNTTVNMEDKSKNRSKKRLRKYSDNNNQQQQYNSSTTPNVSQNFTSSTPSPSKRRLKKNTQLRLNRDKYKKQIDVRNSSTSTELALNPLMKRQSINYNSIAGQSQLSADNKSVHLLLNKYDSNRYARNDQEFFTSPERADNRLKANGDQIFFEQPQNRERQFFQSLPRLKRSQLTENEDGIEMRQIKLQINNNNPQKEDLSPIDEKNQVGQEDDQNLPPQPPQQQSILRKQVSKLISQKSSNNDDDNQFKEKQLTIEQRIQGRSLFIFSQKNKMRIFFAKCVSHKVFEGLILFFILASSVILAIENPLDDPKGEKAKILFILDAMMTSIFCLEAALKIISFGFLFQTKHAYLRNCWNIMDFIIVIFSVVTLAAGTSETKALKAFRLLRVLRPLRVISRNEGLRLGVQSLLMSIPDILNVFIIALLFFLVFGIFCVNYFKGGFFYCQLTQTIPVDGGTEEFTLQSQNFINLNQQIDTEEQCIANTGTWLNRDTNFDNTLNATMLLFQMSTTEGWVDVMFWGIQSRGINMTPLRNNNVAWGIFFIIIFVVGSLFLINLFVGVVIKKFEEMKQILGKNFLLTSAQREWISVRLMAFKFQPKVRIDKKIKSPCRRRLYKITSSSCFEWFIMISIFINTALMAITWYGQPSGLKTSFQILNYIFAGIFTVEAILKIIAMGKIYFHSGWNCFDFIIVCGTLISILIANSTSVNIGTQATLVRAFRIGRIFRLIHRAKSLKMIFDTFMITIPSLANVGAILLLLIYIYAILGVNLFAAVKLQESLNRHANFQSFGVAFLTLMRASTGQAWNSVMHDTARQSSANFDCTDNPSFQDIQQNGINGCGSKFAYFYFISFVIIVSFIYLNLFIAIILQGFSDTSEQANLKINQQTYQDFRQKWSNYDSQGTGLILVKDLPKLLGQLDAPLGIPPQYQNDINIQRQVLANLRLPSYQHLKYFHFSDVIQALTRQSLLKEKAKQLLIEKRDQLVDNPNNNSFQFIQEHKVVNQLKDITEALEQKNHQSNKAKIFKNMIKTQKKITKKLNKHSPDQMGSQYVWAAWVITRHLQRKVQQRKLKENLAMFIEKSKNDKGNNKSNNNNFFTEQDQDNTQFNFLQRSIQQNVGSISIEQVQFTQMVGGVSFQSEGNVNKSAYQNNYSFYSNQKLTIQSMNTHKNYLQVRQQQLPAYNQSWESQKDEEKFQFQKHMQIQSRPRTPQKFTVIDQKLQQQPRSLHISHDAIKQLRQVQESSISYSRPQSPHQKEKQRKQKHKFKRRFSSTLFSPQKLMMIHSSAPPSSHHHNFFDHRQQQQQQQPMPYSPKFAQQPINYPNVSLMLGTCSTPVSERNFDFTMNAAADDNKSNNFTTEKRSRMPVFDQQEEKFQFDISKEVDNYQQQQQQFVLPQFGESHIRTEQIQRHHYQHLPNIGYYSQGKSKFQKLPPILLSQEQQLENSYQFSRNRTPDNFYQIKNDQENEKIQYSQQQQQEKANLQVSFADYQFNISQNAENVQDSMVDYLQQQRAQKRQQTPKQQPRKSNQVKYKTDYPNYPPPRKSSLEKQLDFYYREQDDQEIDEYRLETDQRGAVSRKIPPLMQIATISSGVSSHQNSKQDAFEDNNQ